MQTKIYRWPDGRQVVLTFDEDTLWAASSSREGAPIGSYQFALVRPDGRAIDLMDDPGEAVTLTVTEMHLADARQHQCITERVMTMVAHETDLPPLLGAPPESET